MIGRMTTLLNTQAGRLSQDEFYDLQKRDADERHQPVIDEWLKGKSMAEIGREFGLTRERIRQILARSRERGILDDSKRYVPPPPPPPKPTRSLGPSFTEKEKREADKRHQAVVDAYLKGATYQEVADQFGVTRGRIGQIIRRARERGLMK